MNGCPTCRAGRCGQCYRNGRCGCESPLHAAPVLCRIPGCDRTPYKGLVCAGHRYRLARDGDPGTEPIATPVRHRLDECGTCGAKSPPLHVTRPHCAPWCWTQRFPAPPTTKNDGAGVRPDAVLTA